MINVCLFQIGNCKNVTVMSLRSNKLEFLPDEIGQMTKLRVLNLSDNRWKHTQTHASTHIHTHRRKPKLWLSGDSRWMRTNIHAAPLSLLYLRQQLPWLGALQAVLCVGRRNVFLSLSPLPPCVCVRVSFRLKNLPFTFTKLKDLAALWLSDNQVSAHKNRCQLSAFSVSYCR